MQTRTRRQKEILDYIKRYIEIHGSEPSYAAIARAIGVSSKAGIAKHIQALENQGHLTKRRENGSFFLEIHGKPKVESDDDLYTLEWLDVPDEGGFKEDWENEPVTVPRFMLGIHTPDKILVYKVNDGGMDTRGICEGDIVLIERRKFPRDNECVAAIVGGKSSVLRAFFRDGSRIELRAENERYESIRMAADKIEILGIYRGLLRPAQ